MGDEDQRGDTISANISGPVSGQVAVGKDIAQSQQIVGDRVTEAELAELHRAFEDLRAQVAAEAPPEQRDAALERVGELEQAIVAEEPDLTTMEYVSGWFSKNLPKVAGTVTGLVVHPIVGKLVEAAGEALAGEFKRRFGVPG